MNYNTVRVKNYKSGDSVKSQMRKHYSEYLVLAVLKSLYPNKFKDAILSERPDIQCGNIGVEVTLANYQKDMQVNAEFSRYCRENNSTQRKETIEKSGKYKIIESKYGKVLCSGGGANTELFRNKICDVITNKYNSIKKYSGSFPEKLELAILQSELIPSEYFDKLESSIISSLKDKELIKTVYFISSYICLTVNTETEEVEKHCLEKDCYNGLKKIAKMTVENILTLNDEEWTG